MSMRSMQACIYSYSSTCTATESACTAFNGQVKSGLNKTIKDREHCACSNMELMMCSAFFFYCIQCISTNNRKSYQKV